MPLGPPPTVTVASGWCAQPCGWLPLQELPSITETVPGRAAWLVTKTVFVTGSTATASPKAPTAAVAGFCPHPEVSLALHVAPLMTDTVLSPALATYTVLVAWSTASPRGILPTLITGDLCAHPDTLRALHAVRFTTDTVPSPEFGT